MELEDRLTVTLGRQFDEIAVPPGDLQYAVVLGRAQRRRRGAGAALFAAVLALAIAIPISQLGREDRVEPANKPWGTWSEIAPAPLSTRLGSLAFWTGKEAIFWGGVLPDCEGTFDECGPDTPWRQQGAAYDPSDHTWRSLPDAPLKLYRGLPHVQIDGKFLIEAEDRRWWSYDSGSSRWARLPDPPDVLVAASVTSRGSSMYAVGQGLFDQVWVFDTDTNTWSSLPPSPAAPKLADRSLVGTPAGLLSIGRSFGESPDGFIPIYRVDFFDGQEWTRLGGTIPWAGTCCLHWTGDHLVVPDVAADLVTTLEDVGVPAMTTPKPSESSPSANAWSEEVLSGPMMAWSGNVYDDRDESTGRLGRPVGAPDDIAAAVWADHELIVLGGQNPLADTGPIPAETSRVWIYKPRE